MAGGRPRYRERTPDLLPSVVRDLVECAWRADSPYRGHRQRVLPDGCMDLIAVDGRVVVAGPDTAAHDADQPAGPLTGLRFRPGALPALLGVPADDLLDRRLDLDDVLAGPSVRAETRLIVGSRSAGDEDAHRDGDGLPCLLRTAAVLRSAAENDCRMPGPLPRPALRALARGMPAGELADRLGITSRTLHRRCRATLGYGPSTARRILRFRAATVLLFDGVAPAEVAARSGYADQPHLSREIRALSGVSPTALAVG